MKALSASVVALVLAAMPIVCSPASTDKTLENKSGQVLYGPTKTPTKSVARNGQVVLNDSDYAQTGANSIATITLPDSSVVTMAQNTNVQMQSFDAVGNKANFFVVGKVRFDVRHPAGAAANYTFQTATGQIAVRGTIGDIAALTNSSGAATGLQVNVYALGSSALPVQVTLVTGQTFTLVAGQSLVVSAAATGALVSSVGAVSNSTFAPFSQLGAPANAGSLGITSTGTTAAAGGAASGAATGAATGAAATTTAVAATTVGAVAATTVISQAKPTDSPSPSPSPSASASPTPTPTATPTPTPVPTPTPTPTPSSTSVPIVIQNQPTPGSPAVPAPPSGPARSSVSPPSGPVNPGLRIPRPRDTPRP